MTYRERFDATMRHKPVDRVPMDLAGTRLSGINDRKMVRDLALHLGYNEPYTGDYTYFDERILGHFDIDFRRVGDILQPESPLARRISDTEQIDCWGVRRVFTGLYWDIVESPLKGAEIEDLEKYQWPKAENVDPGQIDEFTQQARYLYNETGYVVCGGHPVYGVFELGCYICGFDDFLLKMAADTDFVYLFFDKALQYQKDIIDLYYGAIGKYLHLTTSGDDFGTQTGAFMSPAMFEEMVKPYLAERIAYTRRYTDAYYFHHTCGSVFPLIPHLIDAGVDILNPIQPGAKDMEPEKLKAAYGEQIVFHGGIDTQYLLPKGTVEEVTDGVRRVLDALSRNSGYILAPAHNLQPGVSSENIAAIFETGKSYPCRG